MLNQLSCQLMKVQIILGSGILVYDDTLITNKGAVVSALGCCTLSCHIKHRNRKLVMHEKSQLNQAC